MRRHDDTHDPADWFRDAPVHGLRREHESMARHCSWRAGGAADRWFEPVDLADLVAFMRVLPPAEPLLWLGLGSNLLVRDGGLRGTVIATGGLTTLDWRDARTLHAGCGVSCAKIAKRAAATGLGGGEFLAGIPGSIGGALAMNAGAFDGEIWSLVVSVDTIDRSGTLRTRAASEFDVAYRRVTGPTGEWFVAGTLRFAADAEQGAAECIRALLARRNETQPLGLPSCGSTFKNPPGDFAGRLIEAAGLKGMRRGGAYVSPKHANFLINDGTASAADIEGLMEDVRARVLATAGVRLEHEVRIVGEVQP